MGENKGEIKDEPKSPLSRRNFVRLGATALVAMPVGGNLHAETGPGRAPAFVAAVGDSNRSSSFVDLLHMPDRITVYEKFARTLPDGMIRLERQGQTWAGSGVEVETVVEGNGRAFTLSVSAPAGASADSSAGAVALVHVRWQTKLPPVLRVLGDAWERSYGELGWRNVIPERVLPWYCATFDDGETHGYGVKTDARSLCFWQVDEDGISLWMNVMNGGEGVLLGSRRLKMATVVARLGKRGEDSVEAVTELCKSMCARPSRPLRPIYGANDWNYSYGSSTAESILRDTEFIAELSPTGAVRPFSVIDGGWENGTKAWPDMGVLAKGIRERNARPGIWIRPLEAPADTPSGLLVPAARFGQRKDRAGELAYDPTVPEAQEKIRAKVLEAARWGYEMVKHDFSTYDLLGQWGFEMGPQPTQPGWRLHDRTRTNAEIISDCYAMIRSAAGDGMVVDGCNTIGHLGQGIFDMQRTGDDTSGRQWERTRRMGVNTAGFRLPQHGTFFCLDADLVGITDAIPWELNRQWLDMLARSGATTMISPGPPSRGTEQRAAIREAFHTAAVGGHNARPVDWMETSAPTQWKSRAASAGSAGDGNSLKTYDWNGADGVSAFLGP